MLTSPKRKNFNKYYPFIILLIISVALNLFQFNTSINYKKEIERLNKGWTEAENILNEEKRVNDSAYFQSLNVLQIQLKELDSLRIADKKKFDLQISQLKSKYDKEFIRVSNTPVDGTATTSSKYLSQDIDYSKFQRK